MSLILAPMHGLADAIMREHLTTIGGFDECVSEFIRITHTVHSNQTWLKSIPELTNNGRTLAGTPCTVQLLGSDLNTMPENALKVCQLGANRIDLNFGCPAPSVNKHRGGAILLKEPETIYQIVWAVKQQLPDNVRLTAKMRLGYEDTNLALECAHAIERGGASMLTVHARTKLEGYQPPAHWDWIRTIKEHIKLPVIANGDIFSLQDYINIKKQTGCTHFMLGRGVLRRPDLAKQIQHYEQTGTIRPNESWLTIKEYIHQFFKLCMDNNNLNKYPMARLKQWLNMLKNTYPEAKQLFEEIRPLQKNQEIAAVLEKNT
ncbi:tRNA dihydrouridine synthase [Neisseria sp. Ec49-e6-T10]|uniref:tRNA dihydrouridine synthase n=1 Tax=Neisseria sp. Ec49-e6-T10 TaxID=3140744 RepID=UPI003EB867BF